MWTRALVAAALSLTLAAEGQAQGAAAPPVVYQGCLQLDPTACSMFTFAQQPTSDTDPDWWTFWPQQAFQGSQFLYHLLEDFSYTTPDGSCQGFTRDYYFYAPACAITQRLDVQYSAQVAWFDENSQQHRTMIVFSAIATPEPATLLLLGSGLAGIAAAARRRRRAR